MQPPPGLWNVKILHRGGDVNARCLNDVTLLHFAAQTSHVDVLNLLLEHGADVMAKIGNGVTPLQAAEEQGWEENVAILRDRGE